MRHIDKEIQSHSTQLGSMWLLVLSQLDNAYKSFVANDLNLASEVVSRERRVDTYELQMDRACESYIALYSPVAVDLRQILSLMAICRTLERIGDFASSIALHTLSRDCIDLPKEVIESLEVHRMFEMTQRMLTDCYTAFEQQTTQISSRIIEQDETVSAIYHEAPRKLTEILEAHPDHIYCGLKLLLMIRKLERIGNHCSNIVEELVFYIDARVLKHSHRNERNAADR